MDQELLAGQKLARGVQRLFVEMNFASVIEFVPTRGLRVDVIALSPKGEIWIVECKSSKADFTSDFKWQGYLEWCDQFYFATPTDFPHNILPTNHGLILADSYAAVINRPAPASPLSPARRKKLTLNIARTAAQRLHQQNDPRI